MGGGKVALPAWEPQGTPSRTLWEATNRICGSFLGSVLFLLDCAGVSLFQKWKVWLHETQPGLCDSRLLGKGKGIWHHGKEPKRKLILQGIWQCWLVRNQTKLGSQLPLGREEERCANCSEEEEAGRLMRASLQHGSWNPAGEQGLYEGAERTCSVVCKVHVVAPGSWVTDWKCH